MIRLAKSQSVTLDAAGSGTLIFAPERAYEKWKITRMTTSGTSATVPILKVFRDNVGGQLLDTSRRSNGAVSETNLTLLTGDRLIASYTGGTAGAVMTFYVEGEITRGV